jgi:hypothetical protein
MANRKLVSRIFGGIGNQLFIYASSRALSLRTKTTLSLESKTGFLKDNFKRTYKLNQFNILAKDCSWVDSFYFLIKRKFPWLKALFFTNARDLKELDSTQFYAEILTKNITGPTYMEGYWQSVLYFQEFEKEIRNELKFKNSFSEKNKDIVQSIKSKNSVAIHVRRVEYNSKLNLNYYMKGIDFLKSKLEAPFFYVFSDDIMWCKDNLKIESPTFYIDHNVDNEIADLYLMTYCKHFIIANSSFSWWGAWLSQYQDKIVVAPLNPGIGIRNHLYPNDWVLIDNI